MDNKAFIKSALGICVSLLLLPLYTASDDAKAAGFFWSNAEKAEESIQNVPYENYYPEWMKKFRFEKNAPVGEMPKNGAQLYNVKVVRKRLVALQDALAKDFEKYCKGMGGTAKFGQLSECATEDGKKLGGYYMEVTFAFPDSVTDAHITHYSAQRLEADARQEAEEAPKRKAFAERRKKSLGTNGPTGVIQFRSGEKDYVARFGTEKNPEEYVAIPQKILLADIKQLVTEKATNGDCNWSAELWDGTQVAGIKDLVHFESSDSNALVMGYINFVRLDKEGGFTTKKISCSGVTKISLDSKSRAGAPSGDGVITASIGATPAEIAQMQAQLASKAAERARRAIAALKRNGKLSYIPAAPHEETNYDRIVGYQMCNSFITPEKQAYCNQVQREENLINKGVVVSAETTPLTAEKHFGYWANQFGLTF